MLGLNCCRYVVSILPLYMMRLTAKTLHHLKASLLLTFFSCYFSFFHDIFLDVLFPSLTQSSFCPVSNIICRCVSVNIFYMLSVGGALAVAVSRNLFSLTYDDRNLFFLQSILFEKDSSHWPKNSHVFRRDWHLLRLAGVMCLF